MEQKDSRYFQPGIVCFVKKHFFGVGLLVLTFFYIPILCRNRNMLVAIHDELDGELLTYLLQLRHLHEWNIPELFQGAGKASMITPAPLFMLPYVFFDTGMAFFINYIVIAGISYTGMYLCVRKVLKCDGVAALTGLLFALLPFYSVYGLTVMGQPLLLYAFLSLWRRQEGTWRYYFIIIIFGLSSSLVLAGFADLTILLAACIYGLFGKRDIRRFGGGFLLLLMVYLITNISLLQSVFGSSDGFVSHKTEYVAEPTDFYTSFRTMFQEGQYHAVSRHTRMVMMAIVVFAAAMIFYGKLKEIQKKMVVSLGTLLALALIISLFYATWHCAPVTRVRNAIGSLFVSFQADRFYWLYPCIWFLIFAYSLYLMYDFLRDGNVIKYLLFSVFIIANASFILDNGVLEYNLNVCLGKGRPAGYASVDGFYQEEMFDDVNNYIGMPKETYQVISVGLYPSIALYNGFYCLDGYSNNYDVNYKHEFRKIIARELKKDSRLASYFDNWGNRCYIFLAAIPKQYYIDKNAGVILEDLDLDFEQLKVMGCRYVFSAVEIQSCPEIKFEKKFTSETADYDLFLYSIR